MDFNNIDSIYEGLSRLKCKGSRSRAASTQLPTPKSDAEAEARITEVCNGLIVSKPSTGKSASEAVVTELGRHTTVADLFRGQSKAASVPSQDNKAKVIGEFLFSKNY
jgi:hypothetical protein